MSLAKSTWQGTANNGGGVMVYHEAKYDSETGNLLAPTADTLDFFVVGNKAEVIGIVSTTPTFDADPPTIAWVVNRYDKVLFDNVKRYNANLKRKSAADSKIAQQFEDFEVTEEEAASDGKKIIFVYIGPKIQCVGGEGFERSIYAGYGSLAIQVGSKGYNQYVQSTLTVTMEAPPNKIIIPKASLLVSATTNKYDQRINKMFGSTFTDITFGYDSETPSPNQNEFFFIDTVPAQEDDALA